MCNEVVTLGDLCVWCRKDTSFGSGKFVNRYPAWITDPDNDDVELTGYCCYDCQLDMEEELDNEN